MLRREFLGGRGGRGRLLVGAAVLWLIPAPSWAQTPVGSAVLYEVNEALRFVKGHRDLLDPAEFGRRVAKASLLGKDVQPLSQDSPFQKGCFIQANATSNVDLATGKGPIRGDLSLLVDTDPKRESLDTLVIKHAGTVSGELDLTTATQGFANLEGTWRLKTARKSGTLQGVFLIPFLLADGNYYYINLGLEGPGSLCGADPVCPLRHDEFSLGIPLTKLLVTFFER